MRKFIEWLYFTFVKLSLVAIILFCAYYLYYLARFSQGTTVSTFFSSYFYTGLLFACLYVTRHCVIQIFSLSFPYTIDGDKLFKDYDMQAESERQGNVRIMRLKSKKNRGHSISLSIASDHSVPILKTTNEHIRERLNHVGWNITTESEMDPDMDCYIVAVGGEQLFLSEYQTIDLFCYLMAEKGEVADAEDVDDEIEKYLSGLGFGRGPG